MVYRQQEIRLSNLWTLSVHISEKKNLNFRAKHGISNHLKLILIPGDHLKTGTWYSTKLGLNPQIP